MASFAALSLLPCTSSGALRWVCGLRSARAQTSSESGLADVLDGHGIVRTLEEDLAYRGGEQRLLAPRGSGRVPGEGAAARAFPLQESSLAARLRG